MNFNLVNVSETKRLEKKRITIRFASKIEVGIKQNLS